MANIYQDAFRRRLNIIGETGADARNRVLSRPAPNPGGFSPNGIMNNVPLNTSGNPNLESFINSIAQKESGGNYGAVNRSSGALGKYQIMPGNVPAWSKAALGRSVSPQEFLRNPQLQEQVARFQLANYYKQFGPAGAAVAWYSGPGNVKKYLASGGNSNQFSRKQGAYPSINDYARSVVNRMR